MCGRIVQTFSEEEIRDIVDPKEVFADFTVRYNIAPSMDVALVCLNANGERQIASHKWGFVPHWAKPDKALAPQVNARSEGIESKPYFRQAYSRHRGLVPVTGFYEWKRQGAKKQPYYFHRSDDKPFFLAAIWDGMQDGPERSFAIITTKANSTVGAIHDRMPVIIEAADFDGWLRGKDAQRTQLMRPWDGDLEVFPVSTIVNSPAHDSAECLDRVSES